MYSSDLGSSAFLEDVFYWDNFQKKRNDGVAHLFTLKRVKKLKLNHRSLLLEWIEYVEDDDNR